MWEKYKNLAAGLDSPNDQSKKIAAGDNKTETKQEPQAQPKATHTGIDSILNQYYANKESRTKMRVLRLNEPARPSQNAEEKTSEIEQN